MKLKKVRIIIKTLDQVNSEWKKALKGEYRRIQPKNEIVLLNFETAARIFSKGRMEILQTIVRKKPESIYELAKILGKDFKTVHTDVKFLHQLGLIELKETDDARNGLKPIALFSGIELDWAA